MPKQNPHAFKIRIGEFSQDIDVYSIVRKNCGVLSKADLIEPDRNRAHDT
ncbi:MAG: hypothetical protein RO009_03500 [Pseudorhodoplanes sp.]|nr:hypothetical protein [Pseudorhodoplanes sp.]